MLTKDSMESSSLYSNLKSSTGHLQQQEKIIQKLQRTMSLSARPLKKRRVASIPDKDVSGSEEQQQQMPNNGSRQGIRKKAQISERSTKKLKGVVSPSPPSSPATVTKKSVTWNVRDGDTVVYVQPDISQTYPDYNENDVWYTRDDYKEFLVDRLQTIESHRYMTANNVNDDDSCCLRGLELFQDETTSEHFQAKRKLYFSTIKMEQMRQGILGINDPERFRVLVAAQSDLALHRAKELAAQDIQQVYPFGLYSKASNPTDDHQSQNQNLPKSTSVSSFSDLQRLRNMMESKYGSPPSSLNLSNETKNNPNTDPSFKNNAPLSFHAVRQAGGTSVVPDCSSTSSNSTSESSTNNSTLFSSESIRQLQQRSMRRLMGIYQNNNGKGTEGSNETSSLFKFARRDSLLGLGKNSASRNDANNSNKNSTLAATEDTAPSDQIIELLFVRQQEQQDQQQQQQLLYQQQTNSSDDATSILQQRIKELLHQRQLVEGNHQQEDHQQQEQQQQEQQQEEETDPSDDATSILRERITELMHQRKQLYDDHEQQQQQQMVSPENTSHYLHDQMMQMVHRRKLLEDHLHHQQQQQASSEDTTPSLVEQVIEMIQRRKLQQEHHPEQTKSIIDTIGQNFGNDSSVASGPTIEEFLIQQQQHHQQHQKRMQLAMMAINTTRFPIRRDTLSHVRTNNSENHRNSIPWNVTSMA